MVEMPEGWPVAIVDGEERALVHPAVRAGHVYAGTGRARGRWSPAPSPRSLVANGTAEPGWRGRVEADRAGQWVCRWRDGATRRNNYLLFGGAPGDAAAATFDAAARFGDALADVRAALIRDARRRGPVQRLAVHSLLVDLARFLPDDDCCATAVWSADFRGDRGLKRTLGTLRGASPPEGEVDAYLGSLVPGLHGRALWLFHAVQHALPEVAALEALARKRRLPPGDALRLMVGFRVGMPDDPLLAVSKSLGYPEGLFRTRAGKVHLASGLMGKLAAALLCSFPADLPLGPASLFADALGRMGVDLGKAAAAAQRASNRTTGRRAAKPSAPSGSHRPGNARRCSSRSCVG